VRLSLPKEVAREETEMRECKLCGKEILLELYCGRCDKIVGNVNADLAAELAPKEIVM
jgi:hypothetical protein